MNFGPTTWVVAALLIILLVVAHELLGHFLFARLMGMKVTKASLFFGPYVWTKQRGETTYRLGLTPLGGSVSILGFTEAEEVDPAEEHRTYRSAAPWRQIVVILAGPAVNLVIGLLIIWGYFFLVGAPEVSRQVESVAKGSPAAGLVLSGDRVVSVDGRRGDAARLSSAIAASRCSTAPRAGCEGRPVSLVVERDGAERRFVIAPVYDAEVRRMRLGFVFGQERVTKPLGESIGLGFRQVWAVAKATVQVPVKVFTEERKELGSIVGAYETTRQATKTSFAEGVLIAGVVSIGLAFINLLVIPPLDGSWVMVSVVQWTRGRRISTKTLERISLVGFILILCLFAIGLWNDIGRIADGTLGQLR